MAYRKLLMIDVREVLRCIAAGHSARKIAREVHIGRKTVARHDEAPHDAGVTTSAEITDDGVHDIARRVQARSAPTLSDEWREVATHRTRIETWLAAKRPLQMCRIHTLLARDHGLTASEDTLVRFAHQELGGRKPRLTVLVRDGDREQEAQIDFGLVGTLADNTGRVRRLYALVMSRYLVVWPTYLQTTEAVYKGLDAAWAFFAATVHVLVPDHMVAIAAKADPLTPTIAPAFLDDGQARNLYVDRARVRAPRDKGRVEHQIPYVRES